MQRIWLLIRLLIAFLAPPIVFAVVSSWIIAKYNLGSWEGPYHLAAQLWMGALALSTVVSVVSGFITYFCIRWYANNKQTLVRYVSVGLVVGVIGGLIYSEVDFVTSLAIGTTVGIAVSASGWLLMRLILGSSEKGSTT